MKGSLRSILQCLFWAVALYSLSGVVIYLAVNYAYTADDSMASVRLFIFCLLLPIAVKFLIQLLSSPLYGVVERVRRRGQTSADNPSVSVLIPAWNEEVGILKTLKSVVEANYQRLEVIVINDGSTDKTHQLVNNFIKQHNRSRSTELTKHSNSKLSNSKGLNSHSKVSVSRSLHSENKAVIKYLKLPNGGKAKAMNQGLAMASGEFIVTIDADSVMDPEAVTQLIKRFTDDKVAAVAGNVVVGNRRKPIELMQQLEYLYGFFFKRADSIFNSVYIIGGAAAAYRKQALLDVGGFDESIITEDIEMSTRLLRYGYKTRYATEAVIYTEGPSDWKALCKQRLRWKYGRVLTFIKHSSLFFSLHKSHSKYLTCLLLPLAVYAEFLLLMEGVLLTIFYGYTIITFDYVPLVFVILFLTSIIAMQIMSDPKAKFHLNLLLVAPVAWLIFYIVDIVEFQALFRSLKRLIKREQLQWQSWSRVGIASSSLQ